MQIFPNFSLPWYGLVPLLAWSIVWKGLALWKAADRREKIWFWVLLVVNTVGILEILYLYVFSKKTPTGNPGV